MSDTAFPIYLHYGTHAARLAFTPDPPASGQPIYLWYETDTGSTFLYDTSWHTLSTSSPGTVTNTGTLTSNALIIGNGGVDVTATTTGTGILTALGINTGSAGAPVLFNGALGTPSSGTLTSYTGLPATTGVTWNNYLNYQDQQAQNTNGGGFTSGAWRTRVLNTEVSDVGGLGTLASNQVTLAAGTYICHASAPAFAVNQHQLRLFNVTDTALLIPGQSAYSDSGTPTQTSALLTGVFTVGASKAIELQHQCAATKATNGFGVLNNFTTEVFAMLEFWKIA